jgi:rhamnogalacturonyl hydrolase YesR
MPSWIWTNAAIGRYYVNSGKAHEARRLADKFLSAQLKCGAWIVRFDFVGRDRHLRRTVAPNDSAYIAANCLLRVFRECGDDKYLDSSQRCAAWIMEYGCCHDLVYPGYDYDRGVWDTSGNIVDTGFTADLFCSLYDITHQDKYCAFADRFITAYLKAFYKGGGVFAPALDRNGNHIGTGVFARGQAWALEGLIAYYRMTHDARIEGIIDDTVGYLLQHQRPNGAWHHVIRPGVLQWFSADDCKGTPVIAAAIDAWAVSKDSRSGEIRKAVAAAVQWCKVHTATEGDGRGGIFSWSPEGGIEPNASVAFVYANCYLGELLRRRKELL